MTAIEVDHLFVFSALDAPEADELMAAGFAEGSPNTHAGQGTACRRFFFANGMLEFLYVTDPDVTRRGSGGPTGLVERWLGQGAGASPFGICLRPSHGDHEPAPFPSWTYGPKYLPGGVPAYEISQRCREVREPFAFFTPKFSRPDGYPPERAQPLRHANGVKQITFVHLETPQHQVPDLQTPLAPSNLQLHYTQRHHLRVEFDGTRLGRVLTLTSLPLTLAW